MGLFKSISKGIKSFFGGPEQKSTTTPVQVPVYTPEQQQLLKSLTTSIQEQWNQPWTPAPRMYVPRTPEEEQYFNWARSQAISDMASGKVPYEVGPEYAQRYFEEAIRPLYQREWEETVLPQITKSYAGPTFHSGLRAEAEAEAARKYATDLAAKKAELTYGEELARRQAIESAMGRVLPAGQAQMQAGQYARAIEAEQVMDAVQRYLMGEGGAPMAYNPMVQLAFQLLGFQPYAIATQTKSTGTGGGLGYGLLTGFAGGAGKALGGMLFSPTSLFGTRAYNPSGGYWGWGLSLIHI